MLDDFILRNYNNYIRLKNIRRKKVFECRTSDVFSDVLKKFFSDSEMLNFKKIHKNHKVVLLSSFYAAKTDTLCSMMNDYDVGDDFVDLKLVTYKSKNYFHHVLSSSTKTIQNGVPINTKMYCQGREKL